MTSILVNILNLGDSYNSKGGYNSKVSEVQLLNGGAYCLLEGLQGMEQSRVCGRVGSSTERVIFSVRECAEGGCGGAGEKGL